MSNSINSVKERIKGNSLIIPCDISNMEITTYEPIEKIYAMFMPEYADYNNSIQLKGVDSNGNERFTDIIYDDSVGFDFCVTTHATHDGTLLFSIHLMHELLYKIIKGEVYNNSNCPIDYADNFMSYNLKYYIGDIVQLINFDWFDINGHMMHGQFELLALPIKVEYELNK